MERRRSIGLDEIVGFRCECIKCGTIVMLPIDKANRLIYDCPSCCEKTNWFHAESVEQQALTQLKKSIDDLLRGQDKNFRFQLEIKSWKDDLTET